MSYTALRIYIKNCEPILSILDMLSRPHLRNDKKKEIITFKQKIAVAKESII